MEVVTAEGLSPSTLLPECSNTTDRQPWLWRAHTACAGPVPAAPTTGRLPEPRYSEASALHNLTSVLRDEISDQLQERRENLLFINKKKKGIYLHTGYMCTDVGQRTTSQILSIRWVLGAEMTSGLAASTFTHLAASQTCQ